MHYNHQHNDGSIKVLSGRSITRYILAVVIVTGILIYSLLAGRDKSGISPVDLVNPLMGTDSEFSLSNGNTYHAIALPWGMNFWTPQTRVMGNGWAGA